MEKFYLIEIDGGLETVLKHGSEKELLEYLKNNVEDLTSGFYESEDEEGIKRLDDFYQEVEEAESLDDIDFNKADYDYWCLEVL